MIDKEETEARKNKFASHLIVPTSFSPKETLFHFLKYKNGSP